MCDIITLSSEDEAESPPKKRIKPILLDKLNSQITITRVVDKKNKSNSENEIHELLSDDDDEVKIIQTIENKFIHIEENTKEPRKDTSYKNDNITSDITSDDDDEVKIIQTSEENILHIEENTKESRNNIIIKMDDDIEEENSITADTLEIINENSKEQTSVVEESPDKENKSENVAPNGINKITTDSSIPSTSSSECKPSNTVLLEKFFSICKESIKNSKFQVLSDRFPVFWKNYQTCEADLRESSNFKNLIDINLVKAQKSTALAVISFNDIFLHLKELVEAESVEVDSETLLKLKKLKKTIKQLMAHIKVLEESEVDFSDEDNSVYLQMDRYNNRLAKVHKKYCELLNKNPYSGRLTYTKLDFSDSEYNEINRAISKKYKNNKKFPSYVEMETFIKKVVAENNLELSQSKIKSESVHCFKKLGELLQDRRRRELYDSHHMHIKDGDDPAKDNPALNSILKESYEQGQKKIEKLVQSYVIKDQQGEKAISSEEESDKSDYVDSEDEGNENADEGNKSCVERSNSKETDSD